jgi:hypothetical protein
VTAEDLAAQTALIEQAVKCAPEFAALVQPPDSSLWHRHASAIEHLLREVESLRERHRAERDDWRFLVDCKGRHCSVNMAVSRP